MKVSLTDKMNLFALKKILGWTLAVITIIYLISGLGIMYFRVIESITFGVLTKNLSFNIHSNLLIPFLILLLLHIYLTCTKHKLLKRFVRKKE